MSDRDTGITALIQDWKYRGNTA